MTLPPAYDGLRVRPGRFLRALLVIHGIVTLAAATVLAVLPTAIPASVGILLDPDAFLLAYFLAAAELAIGVLSIGAMRLADRAALNLILRVFILFHLTTAALEVVYLSRTAFTPTLLANIVVRIIAAVLLFTAGRSDAARHRDDRRTTPKAGRAGHLGKGGSASRPNRPR